MDNNNLIRIDGIKWWIMDNNNLRVPVPLCPQHNLRLKAVKNRVYNSTWRKYVDDTSDNSTELICAEEDHKFPLPRKFKEEKDYIVNRVDSKVFAKMRVLNLDDEAIPVAEEELKEKDSPYWVKAKVTESKAGLRLVVWAGDRGEKSKTQLFVEPELQRLGFDQNDDHPTKVFTKVEAIFAKNHRSTIQKG